MKNPKISIIIRTRNEEKYISQCLKKISQQTLKDFEIIIVDNNSSDLTVKKARLFTKKIIKIKKFLPGKAINEGIRSSRGKIIVITSAHCIPVNNNWLKNLIKDLSNKKVAGVYGRQEPMRYTSDFDKRDLLTIFGLDKKIQIKDTFFHNANSAFRKEIWKRFPFDEKTTNIEDRIWGEKVISKGFKIIYEPTASVYHYHGVHQNLNKERAKNVVNILESLKTFQNQNNKNFKHDLKILAIIPSKGKPIKYDGKYLLKKTILTAQKSKYIDEIVVSTDNKSSARIAKSSGAKVPFIRPSFLSKSNTQLIDVLSYTIKNLEKKKKYFDLVVILADSYPFRSNEIVDTMIEKLLQEGSDTLIAAKKESRGIWLSEKNKISLINDPSLPRKIKQKHAYITLFGLCCVTHPSNVREKDIFKNNYSIFKVDDILNSIDIFDLNRSKLLNKEFKKFSI